jgi:hypothetical protein
MKRTHIPFSINRFLPGFLVSASILAAVPVALLPACASYQDQGRLLASQALYFATPALPSEIPEQLVDAVGSGTVLLLGESHYVQEHQEFVSKLLLRLHQKGLRVFMQEGLHAYGWLLDEYARGVRPGLTAGQMNLDKVWLDALRDFNAGLRAAGRDSEQIRFACFDMNHWPESYGESASALAERSSSQEFKSWIQTMRSWDGGSYRDWLVKMAKETEEGDGLGLSAADLAILRETTRVELLSEPVRARWSDAAREDIIYANVRQAIDALKPGEKIAINCGMWHAQLDPVWNASADWLGKRLAADYSGSPRELYSLALYAARGQGKSSFASKQRSSFDVQRDSRPDDLSRMLDSQAAGRIAFLDMADAGVAGKASIWFGGSQSVAVPGTQFSGILMYPSQTVLLSSLYYEE